MRVEMGKMGKEDKRKLRMLLGVCRENGSSRARKTPGIQS